MVSVHNSSLGPASCPPPESPELPEDPQAALTRAKTSASLGPVPAPASFAKRPNFTEIDPEPASLTYQDPSRVTSELDAPYGLMESFPSPDS